MDANTNLATVTNLYFQHENRGEPPTGEIKPVEVQQHLKREMGNPLVGHCKAKVSLPHIFFIKTTRTKLEYVFDMTRE